MLVYPALVLALGALWLLDWTNTRLDSLSPVTANYHGSTWTMAEKVAGGDDPDEEVVVKNLKDTPKGSDGWFTKLAKEWDLVGKNGDSSWDTNPYLVGLIVIVGVVIVGVAMAIVPLKKDGSSGIGDLNDNKWIGPLVGGVVVLVAILMLTAIVIVMKKAN